VIEIAVETAGSHVVKALIDLKEIASVDKGGRIHIAAVRGPARSMALSVGGA